MYLGFRGKLLQKNGLPPVNKKLCVNLSWGVKVGPLDVLTSSAASKMLIASMPPQIDCFCCVLFDWRSRWYAWGNIGIERCSSHPCSPQTTSGGRTRSLTKPMVKHRLTETRTAETDTRTAETQTFETWKTGRRQAERARQEERETQLLSLSVSDPLIRLSHAA